MNRFHERAYNYIRNNIIFYLFHHEFNSMYFAGENHFFSSIFDQLSYLLIIGFNHYSMLHHRIWKIRWRENGLHIYPASIATLDKFMKFRRRVNSLQHVIYEKSICCFSIFLVKIPKCQDITSFVASFFSRCTFSQENGELSMKNSTIATYCAVQCSAVQCMTCTLTSIHSVHNVYSNGIHGICIQI